ncbi:MAG: ABC transporter ATP-binding protein, partial [Lachnospiraceae bacterium]|nr:ABC transporter ATP-binding protein [Lachnospiraceae bacterium]
MSTDQTKTSKTKPKDHMWQNSAWMVSNAWRICKSVLFLVLASALVSVAQTTSQMLIAPVILDKVETAAPLSELLGTIAVFAVLLFLLAAASGYIGRNTIFGRIQVRMDILYQIYFKCTSTSFPNLLDTAFIQAKEKADTATESNNAAAEGIWDVWGQILTSIIGFIIYLAFLSSLNPVLLLLVVVTAIIGYLVNKKIQNWEYTHRDEAAVYEKQMEYIDKTATSRKSAKDIRIFGLQSWLTDVWNSAYRLYRAYTIRRERHKLWLYFTDMLLALIRNGSAYAYLISLALTNGLSASEFLLYFNAFSGFTEWIKTILEQFGRLNEQSIDLSVLREFLEWPEPFRFEGGKPLP